jgi:hypothetical protein
MLVGKMMRRVAILLVIAVPALYGAGEVWATKYTESALAKKIKEEDSAAQDVKATVSTPLVWGLVTRNIVDRIEASAGHVKVGPFFSDRVSAVLHGVVVDRSASIKQRQVVVQSIDRLDAGVELSQEEVSKILPNGFSFRFQENGAVEIAGPIGSITGKLVIVPPSSIKFQPATLSLLRGLSIPIWDMGNIPLVTCIHDIQVRAGSIKVTCTQYNPPAKFPP